LPIELEESRYLDVAVADVVLVQVVDGNEQLPEVAARAVERDGLGLR
jgi:hypothetical protein